MEKMQLTTTVLGNGNLKFEINAAFNHYLKGILTCWEEGGRASQLLYEMKQGLLPTHSIKNQEMIVREWDRKAIFKNHIELEQAVFTPSEGELKWIKPVEIAALTAAPIVGFRDERGIITEVWWYPQYETKLPIEEMVKHGFVIFEK